MRKFLTLIFGLLIFTVPLAQAENHQHSNDELISNSLGGGSGAFRLQSAQRAYGDEMSYLFGFHAEYFSIDNLFAVNDNTSRLLGQFSATVAPCSYTEFFVTWMALSSTDNSAANLIQQFGNFNVGAKVGLDLTSVLSLSAAFQAEHLVKSADLNLTNKAWNYWPQLLATLDLTRLGNSIPLRLHTNVGYRIDNSIDLAGGTALTAEQNYYLNIHPNNQLTLGLGVEVPADFINFSLEYSTEQDIETSGSTWADNPQRITVGAKLFPTERRDVSIDVGSDIGIFNDTPATMVYGQPDFNIIFGLSYSSVSGQGAPRSTSAATGAIAGIVLEDASLKPIGNAIITFPEIVLTRLQSHPENGTFGFGGIAPGTFTARCELDGYEPADLQITIVAGGSATPEFRLKKKLITKKGTLMLKLTNADKLPLAGQMSFVDHPTMEPLPVPTKGMLAKLPAETFRIRVSSEGYQPEEHSITIDPDGKLVTEYLLREADSKVQLVQDKIVIEDRIHFQTGKWIIKPESFGILNRVADLINDTVSIARLRVEGHTDSVGKESYNIFLSQKRAESVKQYLTTRGVKSTRLESVGYGPSRPIQPNDTAEGKALNRRVEFTVVAGEAAAEQVTPMPAQQPRAKKPAAKKPAVQPETKTEPAPASENAAPAEKPAAATPTPEAAPAAPSPVPNEPKPSAP